MHVWQLSRHVSGNEPLPYIYSYNDPTGNWNNIKKLVFPHHLDLLARELLLHADRSSRHGTKTLARWDDLADTINALKRYADDSFDPNSEGGVLLALHRMAHQQFPYFSAKLKARFGKQHALYRSPELRQLFEIKLGIDVDNYFVLAFCVMGSSLGHCMMNTTSDYTVLGVDVHQSKLFFERIVGEVDNVRAKLIEQQQLNHCWEFTLNAIHFKPLLSLDPKYPERVYCPLPPSLERRLLEGLYFDLYDEQSFAEPYGKAVEAVVQRLLKKLSPEYHVARPEPEYTGKARFDGTDFIVSKLNEIAYVECKGKRLSLNGRVAQTLDALDQQLAILAKAIVQNYANMYREMQNLERDQEARQWFCIVITLEDWILFSGTTTEMLHSQVVEKLRLKNLPTSLIEQVPYRVLSFETAQFCCHVLPNRSMVEVFGLSYGPDDVGMGFVNALQQRFPKVDPANFGEFDMDFSALLNEVQGKRIE